MPPVFGPSSLSKTRLWSCDEASGRMCSPSVSTRKLASSPSRNSSTTTLSPAAPKTRRMSTSSIAASASARDAQISTPLPAARPSALITYGALRSPRYFFAAAASENVANAAVGILFSRRISLANALLPSSRAARRENFKAALLEELGDAERERQLGTDHRQIDAVFLRERGELLDVVDRDRHELGALADAVVARRDEYFLDARALPQLPNERVLAPAAADDEDFHTTKSGEGSCRD